MAAYTPTSTEIDKALGDVYYEIEQLVITSVVAINDISLNNAIVESRLVHVRALLDFFEVGTRDQDDVLAAHYGFPASTLSIDKLYRDRLNKDLAHLTYSRTRRTPADKGWPHEVVVLPVLQRCQVFIGFILERQPIPGPLGRPAWETLRSGAAKAIMLSSKRP